MCPPLLSEYQAADISPENIQDLQIIYALYIFHFSLWNTKRWYQHFGEMDIWSEFAPHNLMRFDKQ